MDKGRVREGRAEREDGAGGEFFSRNRYNKPVKTPFKHALGGPFSFQVNTTCRPSLVRGEVDLSLTLHDQQKEEEKKGNRERKRDLETLGSIRFLDSLAVHQHNKPSLTLKVPVSEALL